MLALIDALEVENALLVGHDWGGYIAYLMAMRLPERFDGFLALNIAHPWQTFRTAAPHFWRFLTYMPLVASLGVPLHRRTRFVERLMSGALSDRTSMSPEEIRAFSERFRDPVCATAARDTYRTFLLHEAPASVRKPEQRSVTVPVRGLHGVDDCAIHRAPGYLRISTTMTSIVSVPRFMSPCIWPAGSLSSQ